LPSVRCAAATEAPTGRVSVAAAAAWESLPGVLGGGENVLLAIKPSMWRLLIDSGLWLLATGLFSAIALWSRRSLPGLSVTMTAQLALFIGLVRFVIALIQWIPRWHVLTNRRIMDIRGIREPQVTSCTLVELRNTHLHSSFIERLVRIGTITFVTTSDTFRLPKWRSIANPDLVHAKIRRAIENALDHESFPG